MFWNVAVGGGVGGMFWFLGAFPARLDIEFVLCTWQQLRFPSSSDLLCLPPNATFGFMAPDVVHTIGLQCTSVCVPHCRPQCICVSESTLECWWLVPSRYINRLCCNVQLFKCLRVGLCSAQDPSIRHFPSPSYLCLSTGKSSGAQELRSYLLPPPPLEAESTTTRYT